ncbi:hypothetical protein K5B43_001548 [Vibrio parahaemolyticus]|uniref:hypothetical protein n=1 Tax=Vibrio parahaemolyticus TaxID=670 RepID=UPI000413A331|nr:hypothetical protein [Vibrio parahaemolyticus]EHY9858311.1 hypothetical protein [Vibrio parahaemolyticus]
MLKIEDTIGNWYLCYMAPTIELLVGFADSTEANIASQIQNYRANKTHVVIEHEGMLGSGYMVTEFSGLTSDTWDLESVFTEHYPNLHRRSAVLTIVGVFEHEFDKLCKKCFDEFKLEKRLEDTGGKGLERAIKYLADVLKVEMHKSTQTWQTMLKVVKLRNALIHQDGKVIDHAGNKIGAIIDHCKAIDSLTIDENNQLILHEGYLHVVIDTYRAYIELVNGSLLEKKRLKNH